MNLLLHGARYLAVVVMFLAGFAVGTPESTAAALRIGDTLPTVNAQALAGTAVKIPDDLRGSVVVLHFWTIGCSSCREEMPTMDTLFTALRKKGLAILAINVGQSREAVKAFAGNLKLSYPLLLDPAGNIARTYDVAGLPRTYILDRKGIIRYKIVGGASAEILKKYVLSLL